ncbi:MAG: hypothetical protein MZU84_02745 [Sphingobacterium sp.]|nr:hypothetical protein [Sphingobacterium sp.]
MKRVLIYIQWIFRKEDLFLHLSHSIQSSGFTLEGKPFEVTEPEEMFDEAFGFKIKSFSDKAEFRQKITSDNASFTVTGACQFHVVQQCHLLTSKRC